MFEPRVCALDVQIVRSSFKKKKQRDLAKMEARLRVLRDFLPSSTFCEKYPYPLGLAHDICAIRGLGTVPTYQDGPMKN